MPEILNTSLRLTASLLETAAGVLRGLAGPAAPPEAPAKPEPAAAAEPHEQGTRPAPGTRSRISTPKAARRVRSREA